MATIVNNPTPSNEGAGMGVVLGVVLVIVLAVLFFVYGLPALRTGGERDINIDVPDKVNVDLSGGEQGSGATQ